MVETRTPRGTGWDENFTKSFHPIERNFFRSIRSHDGMKILRNVSSHGTTRKSSPHPIPRGALVEIPEIAEMLMIYDDLITWRNPRPEGAGE